MSDDQADGWKGGTEPTSLRVISAEEIVAQIERLDFAYDAMAKVWAQIQDNLRHPWRFTK